MRRHEGVPSPVQVAGFEERVREDLESLRRVYERRREGAQRELYDVRSIVRSSLHHIPRSVVPLHTTWTSGTVHPSGGVPARWKSSRTVTELPLLVVTSVAWSKP